MRSLLNILGWIALSVLSVLLPARLAADPLRPGTLISSQATLNYVDPLLFIARDTPSNTVRVVVNGSPGLTLVQDRTLVRPAGAYFEFAHTLTNPGNTTGTYTLTPVLTPGAFALLNLRLILDANGNGTIDVGEPALPFAPHTLSRPPTAPPTSCSPVKSSPYSLPGSTPPLPSRSPSTPLWPRPARPPAIPTPSAPALAPTPMSVPSSSPSPSPLPPPLAVPPWTTPRSAPTTTPSHLPPFQSPSTALPPAASSCATPCLPISNSSKS